jgi:hypothetical protein
VRAAAPDLRNIAGLARAGVLRLVFAMSALHLALKHPLNSGRRPTTVLRWAFHNTRRRINPNRDISLRFGNGLVDRRVDHPVINLIFYVRGGYYDHNAMTP